MKNLIKRKSIQKIEGLIALIAVIGFSMAGCATTASGDVDSSLNGTWVYGIEQHRFNNGTYIFSSGGEMLQRGTYKTSGSNITLTASQALINSTWYTRSELASAGAGATELDTLFGSWTGTVKGDTLTLKFAGITEVFTNNNRTASSASQNSSQSKSRYMLVNTDTLNVRKGPSADNAIVGTLARNTRVEVTDRSAGTWWKIKSGKIEGYVNSTLLREEK